MASAEGSSIFSLARPSPSRIAAFLEGARLGDFSYRELGATTHSPPPGYTLDHNRARLGQGEAAFARAVRAIREWKMFQLGWVETFPAGAGQAVSVTAAAQC